ncbi:hypothetical protein K402DRAFT_35948 [Aulographum hederae CBS 113979]|uniref:Uncharacterized protein n=1 Tax=Aulographum hederae CBS 113979 TaxID=1176131 RepID=A0A6G1H4A5_9PEZI|nr:hypothetical protein K402DRAFT_35948 [Aulographum hederae CBS 113979]
MALPHLRFSPPQRASLICSRTLGGVRGLYWTGHSQNTFSLGSGFWPLVSIHFLSLDWWTAYASEDENAVDFPVFSSLAYYILLPLLFLVSLLPLANRTITNKDHPRKPYKVWD